MLMVLLAVLIEVTVHRRKVNVHGRPVR
jgi:hypothetical protein